MPRSKSSDPETYTKPELRDRLKKQVVAGDKGGHRGQWSARKAQLLSEEYEKQGGGYKKPPNEAQKHLKKWGDEKWTTSDGGPARRKGGTKRYLPTKAWEQLTPEQQAATNRKKVKGSRRGKQFVSNTQPAAKARKAAVSKRTPSKKVATKKAAAKRPASKRAPAATRTTTKRTAAARKKAAPRKTSRAR